MKRFFSKIRRGISGLFYDALVGYNRLRKKINPNYSPGVRNKKIDDLRFYIIMLILPVTQFCIMWIGVNFNSILLAFKEYTSGTDYFWSSKWFTWAATAFVKDTVLKQALGTSVLCWFAATICTMPVSLLISFYFYKELRFHKVFRVIFFLPSVIANIVTVTTFFNLVDRGYPMLMQAWFGKQATGLFVNNETQFAVIIFFNVFYSLSSGFLFFSSAMSGIDISLSEAAQIDGASTVQELRFITFPLIYRTVTVWLIASVSTIFVGDFFLYAFFPADNPARQNIGYYFIRGVRGASEIEYPKYAALGVVLTLIACTITFTLRAIVNWRDPMRDKRVKA